MEGRIKVLDTDYSARDIILETVKKNPKLWFEPESFEVAFRRYKLAGSSPSYINNTLNKMVHRGLLDKEKIGRKVFFRLR